MRFLQLRFISLVQQLGLDIEVGQEYGPFNPICDAGSRGKIAEMEAIMANLNLDLDYVDVPAEGVQLVEDTHAEWLRLSEAERAHAHAAADEAAARQRQHGASADEAPWPLSPPAREGAQRPRSEEERQTGRARLNTDSSGASPYVSRENLFVQDVAAAQELPSQRAPRAAATLADVRRSENLFTERSGERQDQVTHELESRSRAAAAAARVTPDVVVIEGVAVSSHVSRVAAGVYARQTQGVDATEPVADTSATVGVVDVAGALLAGAAVAAAAEPRRKRRSRCGSCDRCTLPECGSCAFCRDMPKNGGRGVQRRACERKACHFLLVSVADTLSLRAPQPTPLCVQRR